MLIDGRRILKDVALAWSWRINSDQVKEQGLCLSLYDPAQTQSPTAMAGVGLKKKGLCRVDHPDVYFYEWQLLSLAC